MNYCELGVNIFILAVNLGALTIAITKNAYIGIALVGVGLMAMSGIALNVYFK
jgi:hypothetical protein